MRFTLWDYIKKVKPSPFMVFIIRRLVVTAFILVVISLISFSTTYLLPGDPVTNRYPDLSDEAVARMRTQMGLDQPLHFQYINYIQSVFRGDFGYSLNTKQPVMEDIRLRLPVSFELTSYALIFATLVGVPLGIIAAVKRNEMGDHLVRIFTIFVTATPAFWAGLISIYIFFYILGWASPPSGMLPISVLPPERVTGMLTVDALIAGDFKVLAAAIKSFTLPVIIYGLSTTPQILRITRSAMIEALQEDYVTLARSIGLPGWRVILQDAFRGSQVPLLTVILNFAGALFLGNALIEQVFSWPGMGRYLINAVTTSDMAPVNTVILLVASLVAILNLIGDIGYSIIDPRIRHGFVSSD